MFDVGRSMFNVHQFLNRSDWTLSARSGARVKLASRSHTMLDVKKADSRGNRHLHIQKLEILVGHLTCAGIDADNVLYAVDDECFNLVCDGSFTDRIVLVRQVLAQ